MTLAIDESVFERIADEELQALDRTLGALDPDEVEVELSAGVLTARLGAGGELVVNSHRAARQIWMAAFRQAWHFDPVDEGGEWRWRTARDELHETISRILSEKVGRRVEV